MSVQKLMPTEIMLAPMEGVVNARFRKIYAHIGGIDRFVTEFIRVTQNLLTKQNVLAHYPEIEQHGMTDNATPTYCQLLGDDADYLAENAAKLIEWGAYAIDLNFGCPAKTVNNHGGGARLLTCPEKIYQITQSVRKAIPPDKILTAKMRLGYKDKSQCIENAQAIAEAGATEIIVHARTKTEGYRPPAHWHYLKTIQQAINIDVVANGEMWTVNDIDRCMTMSQCTKIMLGRGLIANPALALQAKAIQHQTISFNHILFLLLYFLHLLDEDCPKKYQCNLLKQWLVYLKEHFGEAHLFFNETKRITDPKKFKTNIIQKINAKKTSHYAKIEVGKLDLTPLLKTL